jgi:hypothetical protein
VLAAQVLHATVALQEVPNSGHHSLWQCMMQEKTRKWCCDWQAAAPRLEMSVLLGTQTLYSHTCDADNHLLQLLASIHGISRARFKPR